MAMFEALKLCHQGFWFSTVHKDLVMAIAMGDFWEGWPLLVSLLTFAMLHLLPRSALDL